MFNQLKQMFDRVWPSSISPRSSNSEDQKMASTDGGTGSTQPAEKEGEHTETESQLYECPDCQQVYVAIDKDICSSCETEVEAVA